MDCLKIVPVCKFELVKRKVARTVADREGSGSIRTLEPAGHQKLTLDFDREKGRIMFRNLNEMVVTIEKQDGS
jgi:hypothetical protein